MVDIRSSEMMDDADTGGKITNVVILARANYTSTGTLQLGNVEKIRSRFWTYSTHD
jgi:hypothetical protein